MKSKYRDSEAKNIFQITPKEELAKIWLCEFIPLSYWAMILRLFFMVEEIHR